MVWVRWTVASAGALALAAVGLMAAAPSTGATSACTGTRR